MAVVYVVAGLLLIATVLWDSFETIVLPRRVMRRFRLALLFYRATWVPWRALGRRMRQGQASSRRETYFSFYGPLSLLLLLVFWALLLVLGFAMVQFALEPGLAAPEKIIDFGSYLYFSGTTFFTLGLGDVTPVGGLSRLAAVAEGGLGFGFLGLVIGYLPVIYQSFSRREVNISMLDARAGSPPSAVELLNRHCRDPKTESLKQFLNDWERWSADILESHLSYPVLGYFRSQHENQSWLASLTLVLDVCALIMVGIDDIPTHSARLTFAMARHAAVDLSQVFGVNPNHFTNIERLPSSELTNIRTKLGNVNIVLHSGSDVDKHLTELRQSYEPYVIGLAEFLVINLPRWLPETIAEDNWQRTAWGSDNPSLF